MPYKSSEGRSGGKLVKSNLSDNIGGYLLKSVANSEYLYGPNTETSLYVEPGIKSIVVAGVAPGGHSQPQSPNSNTDGYGGGGGGAGNIYGATIDAIPLWNQTIYVKVPATPGSPVYVKTGSHSGTSIWEAGHGANGGSTRPGGAGGQMIAGSGYAGGNGGDGAPGPGGATMASSGGSVTGAAAGGGGGGGHHKSPSTGASGGNAPVPSSYLKPLNSGPALPWTMSSGTGGGGGSGQSVPGDPAGPASIGAPVAGLAEGGAAGNPWPNPNGGGGGGGGGIIVTTPNGSTSYGGGGGGRGADHSSEEYPGPQEGAGSAGFLIVQFVKHS